MSQKHLEDKSETDLITISVSSKTYASTCFKMEDKHFIPRNHTPASKFSNHEHNDLIRACFKLSFKKFMGKKNDSFQINVSADDIQTIKEISKNISTHNDKTHKSELPFIDTNEFSVHNQNYEKIMRDEWLTDDIISFFS